MPIFFSLFPCHKCSSIIIIIIIIAFLRHSLFFQHVFLVLIKLSSRRPHTQSLGIYKNLRTKFFFYDARMCGREDSQPRGSGRTGVIFFFE